MSNEYVREVRALTSTVGDPTESDGPKAIGFRPFEIKDG